MSYFTCASSLVGHPRNNTDYEIFEWGLRKIFKFPIAREIRIRVEMLVSLELS